MFPICSKHSFLNFDMLQAKTVAVVHLDSNESAFSLAIVPFSARDGELHLVVGTAADTRVSPRSCSSGFLRTYKFTNDGAALELHHKVRLILLILLGSLVLTCARRKLTMSPLL